MIRQSGIGAHWDVGIRRPRWGLMIDDMGRTITLLVLCGGIRGDMETGMLYRRSDVSRVRTDELQQHYI